ncbi:hypothetical protein FBZ90_118121 [Nitrospirillum pindoramense]|uniref:Uncharacterized protein n=1 Tax=Nitrospirillum amazonense TaxID=28077 RepID=A0A560GPH9_9PROT|nr:hypothetical protein FBZ90_118121 [Nitrospirillum amazonense]
MPSRLIIRNGERGYGSFIATPRATPRTNAG